MKFIKLSVIAFFLSSVLLSSVTHALPYNKKIKTTIKNVESYEGYIIVNLSKEVENTANCTGPVFDGSIANPENILSFYLDITTTSGRAMYASILTAASARKKTEFAVSSCNLDTNLPIIDSVSTLF